jgi:aspartate/methionine/tyrosine aminotransferase
VCERYRPEVAAGAAPIRVMARMVLEVEQAARDQGIPAEVVATGVVNRTIGDVDLRRISSTEDGPEFVSLADDMGIALPGEVIGGRAATGQTYLALQQRMLDVERQLRARGFDLRMYDLSGAGNPILRELLAEYEREHFGLTLDPQLIYLSLGSLDGLDKFWRGYAHLLRQRGDEQMAVVFPAPSFNVPEWQARSLGFRLHRLMTRPDDHFKVTPQLLQGALDEAPDIRAFYLTVSNNPTAFAYTYDELRALFAVIRASRHDLVVVADLAYIGTADPTDDRRRMQAFLDADILPRTVLAHSFSKTHSLTGDRCGWVAFSDPHLAAAVGPGWTNSTASLPADWQLHYTASVLLFRERPELVERLRALYRHRRGRLIEQLQQINTEQHRFAQVNLDDGGTVYNWSQLAPGEDVFSLFVHTGIGGVPGGGFGYSDEFVRFSIGCVPVPAVST